MQAFKAYLGPAFVAAALCCAVTAMTQTPAPHRHNAHTIQTQAAATPTPPPPPPPNWPINDTPAPPSIKWSAAGLSIEASNSSLKQILDGIATATGTKIEGFSADRSQDQRVFGNFGPGRPRDVLSQLLQGSGYNIVMIGDQGTGAPRELVLSGRKAPGASGQQATSHPAQDDSDDDSYDNQVDTMPQPQPQPEQPAAAPDAARTPQQIQQELQQRQQQLMQQQNQQQQPQTTNPPPN